MSRFDVLLQEGVEKYIVRAGAVLTSKWKMYFDHLITKCDLAVSNHWPANSAVFSDFRFIHSCITM